MLAMIFFFIICNEKTLEMTVSETYNNTYTSNCTPSFLIDGYKSLKQCYMKWYKWQTEQTKKHCAETNKLKRIVKFELVNFPMFCKRIKFIYCIFVFFTHTQHTKCTSILYCARNGLLIWATCTSNELARRHKIWFGSSCVRLHVRRTYREYAMLIFIWISICVHFNMLLLVFMLNCIGNSSLPGKVQDNNQENGE